jgi:Reverse transcriptase (RNA-dependent DNA polymerase)/RNase H-like domain found in reverse transcriptase
VTDFRKLNEATKNIQFNPVSMHEALQTLGQAKYWSSKILLTIDLASGYWQIPIAQESRKHTAITCRAGDFADNVMPFGLKNAPAVFQNLMTQVLGPLRQDCAVNYMDDIIVFSQQKKPHVEGIRRVLERLEKAKLSIKLSKCFFFKQEVKFLGFLINTGGVSADPEKIKPILEMPHPTDIKGIDSFLGFTGLYQRFIKSYAVKTEPIRCLKKLGRTFEWGQEQKQAFSMLKSDLASLPNLQQPDFNKPFELLSDAASKQCIASHLMSTRPKDQCLHAHILCLSLTLTSREELLSSRYGSPGNFLGDPKIQTLPGMPEIHGVLRPRFPSVVFPNEGGKAGPSSEVAKDCKEYVKTCLICQQQKDKPEKKDPPKDTSGHFPLDRIAMDFFGPLPTTDKGNQYIGETRHRHKIYKKCTP